MNGRGNGTVITKRKSLYGFEMNHLDPDKRRKDSTRKSHNIKQLWQRTHEILRLALLGFKGSEIAKMLGITEMTVSNTLNSDIAMEKLSSMRLARDQDAVDVAEEVSKLYGKAIETYKKILDDEKAGSKLKKEVADTILMDIGGHRAPQKIQGQFAHAHLHRAEIEAIKERGRAAALSQGKLIEIPEETEVIGNYNGDSEGQDLNSVPLGTFKEALE